MLLVGPPRCAASSSLQWDHSKDGLLAILQQVFFGCSTSNKCGELFALQLVLNLGSVYWSLEILTFNIVSGTLIDERTLASIQCATFGGAG